MREPKIIIATGTKGVGKTHTTAKTIEDYIKPNSLTGSVARKVLIYDVNMEWTQEELQKKGCNYKAKILSIKDLPRWVCQKRVEVRRIVPLDDEGNALGLDGMLTMLEEILFHYRGGMLVLEDINKYLTGTSSTEIVGLLATNRHKDMDIYIHLQSLSPVTPRMWQNCTEIRFHKQTDDIERYKGRITNPELYYIVQNVVNTRYANGDKRFYVYVDNELMKVHGAFTVLEFKKAIYEYVISTPRVLTTAKKRFPHLSGEAQHNEAIKYLLNEKNEAYNGMLNT